MPLSIVAPSLPLGMGAPNLSEILVLLPLCTRTLNLQLLVVPSLPLGMGVRHVGFNSHCAPSSQPVLVSRGSSSQLKVLCSRPSGSGFQH